MELSNLNDKSTFFASNELLQSAKEKQSDIYLNIAYTDYGGTFLDKILIEYLCENYKDNIIVENTFYCGKNAFVFGDIAADLWSKYNSGYILGFENFEEYYFEREYEEKTNFVENFIADNNLDPSLFDAIMYYVDENANVCTFGVDICESDLIDYINDNK